MYKMITIRFLLIPILLLYFGLTLAGEQKIKRVYIEKPTTLFSSEAVAPASVDISKNIFNPNAPIDWINYPYTESYKGKKLYTQISKDMDGDGIEELVYVGEYYHCLLNKTGCPRYQIGRKRFVVAIVTPEVKESEDVQWKYWKLLYKRYSRDWDVHAVFLEDIPNGVRIHTIADNCDDRKPFAFDIFWDKKEKKLRSTFEGNSHLVDTNLLRDCGE